MKYLYNGVGPLPDIYSVYTPELQTQYPHAVLDNYGGSVGIRLFVCSAPIGIYYHNNLGHILSAGSSADNIRFDFVEFRNTDNTWTEYRTRQGVTYLAKDLDIAYKPVWANADLYRTDRDTGAVTLVLETSDPVPVSTYTPNPAAMLMGFQLGAAIRRMRGMKQPEEEKTPVAYLYNGVQLPKLPEVDFSYALMVIDPEDTVARNAKVYFAETALKYDPIKRIFYGEPYGKYIAYRCFFGEGYDWHGFQGTIDQLGSSGGYGTFEENSLIWGNHDIINYNDNSVYVPASEPVPVYE